MKLAYCGHDFFEECLSQLILLGHEIDSIFFKSDGNILDHSSKIYGHALKIGAKIIEAPISESHLIELARRGVSGIVSAAYPHKIPAWEEHLEFAVNLHSSILPEGRGPFPLQQCLYYENVTWGVSLHEVNEIFDAGPLLAQKLFQVNPRWAHRDLAAACKSCGVDVIYDVFSDFSTYWNYRKNLPLMTYNVRPTMQLRTVDSSISIYEAMRRFRAFSSLGLVVHSKFGCLVMSEGSIFSYTEMIDQVRCGIPSTDNSSVMVELLDGVLVCSKYRLL
jgi:methionyl-tRNA formyltransferase